MQQFYQQHRLILFPTMALHLTTRLVLCLEISRLETLSLFTSELHLWELRVREHLSSLPKFPGPVFQGISARSDFDDFQRLAYE